MTIDVVEKSVEQTLKPAYYVSGNPQRAKCLRVMELQVESRQREVQTPSVCYAHDGGLSEGPNTLCCMTRKIVDGWSGPGVDPRIRPMERLLRQPPRPGHAQRRHTSPVTLMPWRLS